MINKFRKLFEGLHTFLILWATQGLSALGSSMTSYALVIWSYNQHGSALASVFFVIAFAGILVCLYFQRDRHIRELEVDR